MQAYVYISDEYKKRRQVNIVTNEYRIVTLPYDCSISLSTTYNVYVHTLDLSFLEYDCYSHLFFQTRTQRVECSCCMHKQNRIWVKICNSLCLNVPFFFGEEVMICIKRAMHVCLRLYLPSAYDDLRLCVIHKCNN